VAATRGTQPLGVTHPRLSWHAALDSAQVDAVGELVAAARAADGLGPLSDHAALRVRHAATGTHHLLLDVDGTLVGYAQLSDAPAAGTPASAEFVVRPSARRAGYGAELLRALGDRAPDGFGVWAHGQHPAAERLADASGFRRTRTLWQVRRPLTADLPPVRWPTGVTVRTFRVGTDEEAWLRCNARAFAHHPDQGSWTNDDLQLREEEPWFDPAGFFLAERPASGLVGFHWTKVHPPTDTEPAIGEVYVIGVDPDEQGTGLGKALLIGGLQHLKDRGLREAMLYVDEDNVTAMSLYERLGFTKRRADAHYLAI
jgi:mycothiol synthase